MSVSIYDVIDLQVVEQKIFSLISKKISNNLVYIYWSSSDPDAEKYRTNLFSSQSMWSGYASFANYYIDSIVDGQIVVGYVLAKGDEYLSDRYSTISTQRLTSPFKFYTPDETYGWAYFNDMWLIFYQRLLDKLVSQNVFIPNMNLNNIVIKDDVLYYEWLFDANVVDDSRVNAIHPSYETAIAMYQNDNTSLNAAIQNIVVDIYNGGSTPPF